MTVVCAWCQRLGRAAVLGEKEPRDKTVVTHGICDEHVRLVLAEARGMEIPVGAVDSRAP